MYWSLIAFLILLTSLVIHFLQLIVAALQRNRYHPPSDAIIESVLPEEIFEHVLSFSDPLTLVRCRFVSKYWNYQSSKHQIKEAVIQNAINEVSNLKLIRAVYKGAIPAENMLTYSMTKTISGEQDRAPIGDFALAQKHGRYLLELDSKVYHSEIRGLNKEKFCLKTIGSLYQYPQFVVNGFGHWFIDNHEQFESAICNIKPTAGDSQYELMLPLENSLNTSSTKQLMMCRPVRRIPYLLGSIPLDQRMPKLLTILFVPTLVHDVLYSDWVLTFLDRWLGLAVYSVLINLIVYVNGGSGQAQNYATYKWLVFFTIIATLLGCLAFWPHSTEHFAFIAVFTAVFACGYFVSDHFLETKFRAGFNRTVLSFRKGESKPLFVVVIAMVIFMNDWSMVYRSILDLTLFYRLFWNTIHWAIFGLYWIWNNVMLSTMHYSFQWRYFFSWEREAVKFLFIFYAAAVFTTLYGPYWHYTGAHRTLNVTNI